MIQSLTIRGIGPCDDVTYDLDPAGPNTITGPSESGKSTLLMATTLVLWGLAPDGTPFPVEAIRDGGDRAEVELVTARGTLVRRSITRKRSQVRTVERGEDLTACPTEDLFRAQLGPVGSRADVARVVIAPLSWVPLAQANLGRPLRDLVLSLLPPADLRAVLGELLAAAGQELRPDDPTDEKPAKALLTATNSAADQAEGRLAAARARLQAGRPSAESAPAAADVTAARGVLAAAAEWEAHQRRADAHAAELRRVADATARRDQWRAAVAQLGERTLVDAAAIRAARELVTRLDTEGVALRDSVQQAAQAHLAASQALAVARNNPGRCPACEQALPADRLPDVAALERDIEAALKWSNVGVAALEAKREARRVAGEKLKALEVQEHARDRWEAAHRALGTEPVVPVPAAAPVAPSATGAPGDDEVAEARALLARAERAAGAAAQVEREAAAARKDNEAAEAAAVRARAEAARVKVLLDACRRAPTEIAGRQAQALGDTGPVALRFPPKETSTTPEVEVLVDGRPWWLASTGRLVLADLHLRAAVRRLAGLQSLPLVVDRAQDWSGDWPELDGPVIYLVTRAGELVVSSGMPAREAA